MQPNPFSPSQEEQKPESVSPGPLPAPTSAQPTPAPVPVQPVARPAPVPVQAKQPSRWGSIAAVILGLGVVFLLIVAAGLGFWAYKLNTQLTTTQQQLATLQGDYGKLKTDYASLKGEKEKLDADLTQTKTDLEKANTELATAQDSLKTAQDQYTALNAKVEKATKFANVLDSLVNGDPLATLESKIDATDDSGLTSVWNKFKIARSTDAMGNVLVYLIGAIQDSLK